MLQILAVKKSFAGLRHHRGGFTSVEILVGAVVFGIVTIGLVGSYISLRKSYMASRQLNEMYAVLSACPEVDRALEFSSLTSATNCYPNNNFRIENTTVFGTNTYLPVLTVADTSALPAGDLHDVPDSKLISIQLPFPKPNNLARPLELRLLITRNGIGQL